MIRFTTLLKKVLSIYLAVCLVFSTSIPVQLKAMTGPSAPEFSSFESVSTSGMVNDFTGDFSYNLPILQIPGANGGGYAMSLSYKSGTAMDEDASWVGYGWTLNPGSIIRSKSGYPDDVKGTVTQYNDVPRNWTASLGASAGISFEAFSYWLSLTASENITLQYNNKQGFSYIAYPNVGLSSVGGVISLNLSVQDGEGSFSPQINPAAAIGRSNKEEERFREKNTGKVIKNPWRASGLKQAEKFAKAGAKAGGDIANSFIAFLGDNSSRSTVIPEFTAKSYKLGVGIQPEASGTPITFLGADIMGTYSYQDAIASEDYTFYGYLHSHEGEDDSEGLMDYYTEKDAGFTKRDNYLSLPWNRTDQFILMGEGLSGGFRAFQKKSGHYKVNERENETELLQLGIDVMAGLDFGVGASLETGTHTVTAGGWGNDGNSFSNEGDEPFYFSFMMDPAQKMTFNTDDSDFEAESFSLNGGGKSYDAESPSGFSSELQEEDNATNRIPRSSEIIYHTNSQMLEEDMDGIQFNRYSREDESFENYVSSIRSTYSEQIGEFVVYNNSGAQYTYGLPVYAKNEKNLSYNITDTKQCLDQIVYDDIEDDGDASNKVGETDNYTKVGDEINDYYSTGFLLTKITTPNYIDRSMNGPSDDDFGGWTKFNYQKKYGDNNDAGDGNWYEWRIPYNGLINNTGSLSDNKDDMGSFSSGVKEVYYVKSIETNTHIAYFYTSDRLDGYSSASDETAANSSTAKGNDALQKLDSICLYAKDDDNEVLTDNPVIKRIYFDYDYSLMDGQPNSKGTKGSADDKLKAGKLTLKRVWFEYEDVRNARIADYQFEYNYPADGTYPAKYEDLDGYGGFASDEENPDYDVLNVDAWGNYQYDGGNERLNNMRTWVNQNPDETNFDPAAYQLKVIKLPSGGEIHVQYEQDDYGYIQDRKAMAMVSLFSVNSGDGYEGNAGDKYYLNLNDLESLSSDEKEELANNMYKKFVSGEAGKDPEKIYFKFAYKFFGDEASISDCGVEYIDGYVPVSDVQYESSSDKIYVKLQSSEATENEEDDETYSVPREVCKDFYNATRSGNINSSDYCPGDGLQGASGDAETIIYNLLSMMGSLVVDHNATLCMNINEPDSYLRIPVFDAKKGGGIRVKRLLTFDEGLENNDAVLYGQEYVYQNTDGTTSGVAGNEPGSIREENALVGYLDKRKDSDWFQKIISGRDKEQFEGPIGEGILPSPSVGYSRVVVKNIHEDKNTNVGFEIKEFYTTKDFPYDGTWSFTEDSDNDGVIESSDNTKTINGVEVSDMNQESYWLPFYTSIYNNITSNVWGTQGYRFVVNDMNGKPKSNAVYSGSYDYINDSRYTTLASSVEYDYYKPGEAVKVIDRWEWENESDIIPEYRIMGKQVEMAMESRAIQDHFSDFTLELDVSIGYWGIVIIPWVTGMVYINEINNELYTHVTNKVVYLTTAVKSITKYQDGIYINTVNEYFDKWTGEPLINVTNDGYNNLSLQQSTNHDGRYVNFNFPASHYYNELSYKSFSEGYSVESPSSYSRIYDGSDFYLEYGGTNSCALEVFTPGDLLALKNTTNSNIEIYNVGEIVGRTVELLPTGDFGYDPAYPTYQMDEITIVRSARSNQLSTNVGSLVTYGGYPIVTDVPIDQDLLDARQQVADDLNDAISTTGSMSVSLAYSDVYIMDGDSCVPMSITVNTSRTPESHSYTYYDTVINCYPVNCTFGSSSTTTTTTTTGTIAGGSSTTTTGGNQQPGSNDNTGSTSGGKIMTLEEKLDNPPTNEKVQYDFASGTWLCWDCDTTKVKKSGTITFERVTITVGSCEIEFTYVDDADYAFYIDDETGELMYGDESSPCDAVAIECFDFCPNEYAKTALDGVVASSAIWLNDEWDLTSDLQSIYDVPGTGENEYEYGAKGKFNTQCSYDYNTTLSNKTDANGRTYNSGIYDDFYVFNWDYEEANDSIWTKLITNNKSSPHGVILEEVNALDIYAAQKMGYGHSVPYLVAQNSIYENVHFESFENDYANGYTTAFVGEDDYQIAVSDGSLTEDAAHSGKQSFELSFTSSTTSSTSGMFTMYTKTFENEIDLPSIELNDQVVDEGYSVKLWMNSNVDLDEFKLNYSKYNFFTHSLSTTSTDFNKIAQTGEWTLYEAKITSIGSKTASLSSSITPSVYFKYSSSSILSSSIAAPEVYIDDLRMQPLDAQMTTYVYDPSNLYIVTIFDDQHFGLYYQYNDEGKLIRKLKETTQGIKTITETQYNSGVKNSRP